jgi:hypothetical protein
VGAPNKEARPYDSRFRVVELLENELQQPWRAGGAVVQGTTKARRAPLGRAEGVPQWWPRARVRQRKTTLVTIPSNHPRIAVKMTIHTSDTVDEPTTQLNST